MSKLHSFHIPVMGIGFTLDSPIRVAKYGISSVISLVDDTLIEQMRKHYCGVAGVEYTSISKADEDYRAKRITAYLDLLDTIISQQFEEVKNSPFVKDSEITKYFEMLPENSPLKVLYHEMLHETDPALKKGLQMGLREQILPGRIDVNIMTKLDRDNYAKDNSLLAPEFSDALSALRGYAQSTLNSAIIFSAGINRRLYSYVEKFEDFYENASGFIKKEIVLKVSDYKSALTQGKFFAKKCLWVSEYRIESGLNCGGHAFPSKGFLMGPMLEEFKKHKQELVDSIRKSYDAAVGKKNLNVSGKSLEIKVTAQGGIGTAKENRFLSTYFNVDGTGWGTPFLIVPEAANMDNETLKLLKDSEEKDLYLSDSSPMGVPFNNLKGSLSEAKREQRIADGTPGSPCPKGHLRLNKEFSEVPLCTASREYQKKKLSELDGLTLGEEEYKKAYDKIVHKACICHDLGASPLINNGIVSKDSMFTAVCPGPSLAYFSQIATLKEMVDHIYGKIDLLNQKYRPNMFIEELKMYVEHFMEELKACACTISPTEKQIKMLNEFLSNLMEGIEYYKSLFPKMVEESQEYRQKALEELQVFKAKVEVFISQYSGIFNYPIPEVA